MKNVIRILLLIGISASLTACAPEVGSEKWCQAMKEKPKGEWTANELADFTKHCIF